jgi:DNA-binding MarR family transcriptional regulator
MFAWLIINQIYIAVKYSMRIEDELNIEQFANDFIKAGVNVLYTAAWLTNIISIELKPYNLSFQQYNVLRILLYSPVNQGTINYILKRTVSPNSNITRIVDKLVVKKLVIREDHQNDKRKVNVALTPEGKQLAYKLNKFLEDYIPRKVSTLSKEEVQILNNLLDKARG